MGELYYSGKKRKIFVKRNLCCSLFICKINNKLLLFAFFRAFRRSYFSFGDTVQEELIKKIKN